MPTPHQETQQDLTTDSLWLEVQQNGERWLFELRADDDAAIAVGSHSSAQVQIVSPGVAATHFHFERDGSELVAVPGYRAGLRINSVKAPGPTRLSEQAIIDFCAVSLQINVHGTRPENLRGHVIRCATTPAEYLRALPSETDVTGTASPGAPPLPTYSSFDTTQAAPPRFRTEGLVPLGAAPLPSANTALGPQGTVIMRVVRPETAPPLLPSKAAAPSALDLSRTERIPIAKFGPESVVPASPDSTPTRAEVPSLRRSSAPPPPAEPPKGVAPATPATPLAVIVPTRVEASAPVAPVAPVRAVLPEPATSMKTADFDVAAMAPFFATPASGVASPPVPVLVPQVSVSSEPAPAVKSIPAPASPSQSRTSRAPTWLVAIGSLAQRRPLPVAAAALSGSLVLALALVGVMRLTGGAGGASHTQPREMRPSASAALPTLSAPMSSNATTLAPAPAAASSGAPLTDPRKLLEATTHLASGRYADAEAAYRALASTQPTSAAYGGIADMLERARSPRCRQKLPLSGCPEVIP